MKHYPIILLTALLLVTGCNKEPEYETMYLDAGLKAAFNNKPGSYWIYRDSVSGETDSVYLVSNKLKIDEGYISSDGRKYEEMRLDYDSKHFGSDTSYNLVISASLSTRESNLFTMGLDRNPGQPLQFWFTYPFSNLKPVNPNDTAIRSNIGQYTISSNTFDDVLAFTQSKKADLTNNSVAFWNSSIGLLKLRLLYYKSGSSTSMVKVVELQRWNIIK